MKGLSEEAIDDAYHAHLSKQIMAQRFKSLQTPADPIPPLRATKAEVLTPAATHVLWAGFHSWHHQRDKAQIHIDAARKSVAAGDLETRFWLARWAELGKDKAAALREYDALIAAGGGENPLLAKLDAMESVPRDQTDFYVQALRKLSPTPATLLALAQLQPANADRLLSQCLMLNNAYFPCATEAAYQAFSQAKYGEAVALQEYALALLPHGWRSEGMEKQLKRYRDAKK